MQQHHFQGERETDFIIEGLVINGTGSEASRNEFINELLSSLKHSSGEVVLYIHGFNTPWASAIKTAAQVTLDTSEAVHSTDAAPHAYRIALAFDWASCGDPFKYAYMPFENDEGRIDDAQEHLIRLLDTLERMVRLGCWFVVPAWQHSCACLRDIARGVLTHPSQV